jgi:glycosyltransferase involved in cell wall biosynthesis
VCDYKLARAGFELLGGTEILDMKNTAQAEASRLILCDPVCVLPYGHNVAAMANFRDFVGQYFDSVVCIGSQCLPEEIAQARAIEREFDYYYNDAIPLPNSTDSQNFLVRHADKTKAAKADLLALLKRHKVTKHDALCYPSADFYALHALAHSIDELKEAGPPTIMLRLIGVMETAASGVYAKPMNVVLALINRLRAADLPVKLAAETPRYADYLAMHVDCPVTVAANIETRQQLALPDDGHFTVICPGSARYDKGFLNLLEIFSRVRRHDPKLRIRFQTQLLPDRDLKHQLDYLQHLYAVPGVKILPSQISAEEIATMYDHADLVLLPYAQDVYEFRGSAVLIEAMCRGRHALALDGPAFVDQMRYFGGGTVCTSIADMADKVIECSRQSPQLRYARARQARERFIKDLAISYQDWVM